MHEIRATVSADCVREAVRLARVVGIERMSWSRMGWVHRRASLGVKNRMLAISPVGVSA